MNRKLFTAAAVAAITMAVQPIARADDGHDADWRSQIVGLWSIEVTLRNCATGEVAPVPNPNFAAANTFHRGGTLTEDGARASPALRNTGQGI